MQAGNEPFKIQQLHLVQGLGAFLLVQHHFRVQQLPAEFRELHTADMDRHTVICGMACRVPGANK